MGGAMKRFLVGIILFFITGTASQAYTDRCGVVYWDQTQAGYRNALQNAQQLVLLFSVARKVNDFRVFCEAEKAFHDTYAGYLKAALSIAVLAKQMPRAEAEAIRRAIE